MHFCCPIEINAPCSLAKYFQMRWRLPVEKYWVIVRSCHWGWAVCRRERKRFKHVWWILVLAAGLDSRIRVMGCFSAELSIFTPSALINTVWGFLHDGAVISLEKWLRASDVLIFPWNNICFNIAFKKTLVSSLTEVDDNFNELIHLSTNVFVNLST